MIGIEPRRHAACSEAAFRASISEPAYRAPVKISLEVGNERRRIDLRSQVAVLLPRTHLPMTEVARVEPNRRLNEETAYGGPTFGRLGGDALRRAGLFAREPYLIIRFKPGAVVNLTRSE